MSNTFETLLLAGAFCEIESDHVLLMACSQIRSRSKSNSVSVKVFQQNQVR
jgi:hypothetical protein